MNPVIHPPDKILRAYSKLINDAFVAIRSLSYLDNERKAEKLHDLADAMHNVGAIIADYDGWTNDEKYRDLYLRSYDRKWGDDGFRLEDILDRELAEASYTP